MPLCNKPKPVYCEECKVREARHHIAWCLEGFPEWCEWLCDECKCKEIKTQIGNGWVVPMTFE